jgi:hypothetical protein
MFSLPGGSSVTVSTAAELYHRAMKYGAGCMCKRAVGTPGGGGRARLCESCSFLPQVQVHQASGANLSFEDAMISSAKDSASSLAVALMQSAPDWPFFFAPGRPGQSVNLPPLANKSTYRETAVVDGTFKNANCIMGYTCTAPGCLSCAWLLAEDELSADGTKESVRIAFSNGPCVHLPLECMHGIHDCAACAAQGIYPVAASFGSCSGLMGAVVLSHAISSCPGNAASPSALWDGALTAL